MLKLLRFLGPYRWMLALLALCVVGQTYATLALPDYTARIIDEGIVGLDRGSIYRNGLVMLLISLVGGAFMVAVGFLASRIATGCASAIRNAVFGKVEAFSLQEFNRFSTASLITRSTNDVQQIQTVLVTLLRIALTAPITAVWAIYKAFRLAPGMTWIMASAIGALILVIAVLFRFALPRFRRVQLLVDRLNLVTREILTGLRVIRAFNREPVEERRFGAVNAELTGVNLFVNRLLALMQPAMTLILNLTSVAIVWVGASRVQAGTLQIGSLLAYMQYAMQAIFAFLMISFLFILVPRAAVSANRIVEVLETPITIADPAVPVAAATGAHGTVAFEDVSFTYPGASAPALRGITFSAGPGQTTALVGSTGSGKSTLVNLIPRLYDATAGRILVDGVDVRDMRLGDLYAKVGYVPQRSVLFSGTVASNLRYGAPASGDDDVRRGAEIAQAAPFIEALDGGYDAAVAQGGANLSGGQRQRLSIARAILRRPEVYIFDDSFSALDLRTESDLRAALGRVTEESTVIVVAQRVSSILRADAILVLDGGEIVGRGTHRELLRDSAVYREIAASQLSKEEIAASLDTGAEQARVPA